MKSKMAAGSVKVPELEAMKISNMAATRHFEMRKTKKILALKLGNYIGTLFHKETHVNYTRFNEVKIIVLS